MAIGLSRQRRELLYSIFLILLIPAMMIGSTVWLTSQVRDNFDLELRRKANLANELLTVQVSGILANNTAASAKPLVQALIEQARVAAPELDVITISVADRGDLRILSSSITGESGTLDETPQSHFAVEQRQAVASLVSTDEGNTRQWLVATPVISRSGTMLGVISSRVSLEAADAAMSQTLRNSFIVLGIMVTVVILLLLNHFRFVEYSELFRKQKELDQLKDDFISIATHELKAPMSVIKGYISMSLEAKLPKATADMLQIALDQTDRLARLVKDLLDVSRLEQGRTKFTITTFAVAPLISTLVDTYQAKATAKGLELLYTPLPDMPAVTADADRAQEIYTNLIDNAIKYSVKGTVTVTHALTDTSVITTVRDTGIGMTPEEQSHLFTRFYRAKNDDTAKIEGTGLGLWIIRQYAERMGGSITVESSKGVGTSFIVALPKAKLSQ